MFCHMKSVLRLPATHLRSSASTCFLSQADTYLCAANWAQLRIVLPGTDVGVVSRWVGLHVGLPRWLSGKESTCQCCRCRFDLWVGKIPWRRKWQPTPVLRLENPMDRRAWQAAVTENCAWLSDWPHISSSHVKPDSQKSTHPQLCFSRCWKDLIRYFVHDCLYFRVFNEKC